MYVCTIMRCNYGSAYIENVHLEDNRTNLKVLLKE